MNKSWLHILMHNRAFSLFIHLLCYPIWKASYLFIYFVYRYFLFIPDISIAPLQVDYYSEALLTTALILLSGEHAEALEACESEELAQGPHAADRVGFEPVTFRTQGTEPTTEPPCMYTCTVDEKYILTAVNSWQ